MKFWPSTANLPVKVLLIDTHIGYSTTKLKLPYFDLLAILKSIWDCLAVWKSDFWLLILISNIITHHNQLVHNWKSWFSFFQHTLLTMYYQKIHWITLNFLELLCYTFDFPLFQLITLHFLEILLMYLDCFDLSWITLITLNCFICITLKYITSNWLK